MLSLSIWAERRSDGRTWQEYIGILIKRMTVIQWQLTICMVLQKASVQQGASVRDRPRSGGAEAPLLLARVGGAGPSRVFQCNFSGRGLRQSKTVLAGLMLVRSMPFIGAAPCVWERSSCEGMAPVLAGAYGTIEDRIEKRAHLMAIISGSVLPGFAGLLLHLLK